MVINLADLKEALQVGHLQLFIDFKFATYDKSFKKHFQKCVMDIMDHKNMDKDVPYFQNKVRLVFFLFYKVFQAIK